MTPDKALQDDARDLNRGVIVNLIGYLVKAAHPVLLVLVVRQYGAERFGVFTLVQAVSMFAMRAALIGMDKATLWWVARHDGPEERRGLLSMLYLVGGASLLATLLVAVIGLPIVRGWHGPEAASALVLMNLALVPMTFTEMLLHAILGKRDQVAKVVVRETVVPFVQVIASLALFFVGLPDSGLALGYIASHVLGLVAAIWFFRRGFRHSRFDDQRWPPPPEVVRYALPMWATEMINTFAQRLDVYMLASMADAKAVGIYAAVTQVGNTLRAIRQSFDHIVIALFSQMSSRQDEARLKAGFSRATSTVMVTQMPVYAFLFSFAPLIMPLFGEGFEQGTDAVLILAGASVANGLIAMHGLMLIGYGRSDLILMNIVAFVGIQAGLHYALIPRFGVTGAAMAVGINMTLQYLLQWYQARQISGINAYNHWVGLSALGGLAAASAMTVTWFALGATPDLVRRAAAFLAFMLVGGLILWRLRIRFRGQKLAQQEPTDETGKAASQGSASHGAE